MIGGLTSVIGGLRYSLLVDACLMSLITLVAVLMPALREHNQLEER
jgi:hypothetical protein